ncbi:ral guanine nucleotide dissociation stimulator-like [Thomomys bottae]
MVAYVQLMPALVQRRTADYEAARAPPGVTEEQPRASPAGSWPSSLPRRDVQEMFARFFSNGRGSGLIEQHRGCLAHVCPNKARTGRGHFWRCCHWTSQDEAPSQEEGCRAGTLEQLVEHLVPAQLTGEHFFIPTFLFTYRKFTSTEQVLDLLFQTFSRGEAFKDSSTQDEILPFSSQDGMLQDKLRNAISSILDMWLDEYGEDVCQPPHFACLKQLLAHLKRHMTGSHVESRAQLLLAQMEAQEPSQTQSDGAVPEGGAPPLPAFCHFSEGQTRHGELGPHHPGHLHTV